MLKSLLNEFFVGLKCNSPSAKNSYDIAIDVIQLQNVYIRYKNYKSYKMTKNQVVKQVATQEATKPSTKFKAFQIYADMSKVDRTWEEYGYLKAPLAVRKQNGELSSRSHKNQVLIYKEDFRKLLSNVFAEIPFEFISEILQKYVLKELSDLKMYIHQEYTAHDGDSHYWVLLSEKKFQVDGHDNFQVGLSIRNGLGTNVSLGADLYMMRVICENGAVIRGRNWGSFSIPHLNKAQLIAKLFIKYIRMMYQKAEMVPMFYNKLGKIRMNDERATIIYKHMPFAAYYLPTTWNILSRYQIKDLKKSGKYKEDMNLVNVTTKNQTVLEAYNAITERQRDGLRTGRINFAAVSTHQIGLHNALVQIANQ